MTKNIDTNALATIVAQAVVTALSGLTTEAAPAKAGKAKAPKAKAAPAVTGPTFKEAQAALVVLKAEGKAPAGMTTKQAIAEGLLPALGTTAPTGKKGKKAKARKARALSTDPTTVAMREGLPFAELQQALKEHKVAGLIRAGVSVKQAIAEGLMDAWGAALCDHGLPEVEVCEEVAEREAKAARKAAKKARKAAKVEAVVTEVAADEPAKVRAADGPRRADGTITPAEQWEERERLALTGQFDRFQIDMLVEPERATA